MSQKSRKTNSSLINDCNKFVSTSGTAGRTNRNKTSKTFFKFGDLVKPVKWTMARIREVNPGSDKKIPVVTICTSRGSFKRSVTKVYIYQCAKT